MAFKDFEKAIREQQEKMVGFAPNDIVETLTLKTSDPMYMTAGETIEFTLGKVFRLAINDSTYNEVRPLKPYYVQHKAAFENALQIITRKVALVTEQRDALVAAMAEPIIPEAVLARMRGENPDTDNESLLELMTQKLGKELIQQSLNHNIRFYPEGQFQFYLKKIAGREFMVAQEGPDIAVRWGDIECTIQTKKLHSVDKWCHVSEAKSLEDKIFFIANIELIKLRLNRFLDDLALLQRNHQAEDE